MDGTRLQGRPSCFPGFCAQTLPSLVLAYPDLPVEELWRRLLPCATLDAAVRARTSRRAARVGKERVEQECRESCWPDLGLRAVAIPVP
jgi:hypothetical protein